MLNGLAHDPKLRVRERYFVSASELHDKELITWAKEIAKEENYHLCEGSYALYTLPNFESPCEIMVD